MTVIEFAVKYAMAFIGVPYEWGGDNALGLDCSGFVGVILRAVGVIENQADYNAQGLFHKLHECQTVTPEAGCVVFYGRSITRITHVAFMVDDRHILEAGGGNSKTTSLEVADDQNAMVRGRPYNYREVIAIVDPFAQER